MSLEKARTHFEEARTQTLAWFHGELASIRTARVKPDTLNEISVEHYGVRNALQSISSISSLDARTLLVSPWDKGAIPSIEKALIAANLGAQPVSDGKAIRLSFPALTEEIRDRTVKQLHSRAEQARVRLRQGRDEALKMIREEKESGDLTEDDFFDGRRELDGLIEKANADIHVLVEKKEQEIKTI